jgi:hypothetical protein
LIDGSPQYADAAIRLKTSPAPNRLVVVTAIL